MSKAAFHDTMATHVESASMPGLIALVAHDGDVDVEVIGTKTFAPESLLDTLRVPISTDTVLDRVKDLFA